MSRWTFISLIAVWVVDTNRIGHPPMFHALPNKYINTCLLHHHFLIKTEWDEYTHYSRNCSDLAVSTYISFYGNIP